MINKAREEDKRFSFLTFLLTNTLSSIDTSPTNCGSGFTVKLRFTTATSRRFSLATERLDATPGIVSQHHLHRNRTLDRLAVHFLLWLVRYRTLFHCFLLLSVLAPQIYVLDPVP